MAPKPIPDTLPLKTEEVPPPVTKEPKVLAQPRPEIVVPPESDPYNTLYLPE